GRDRTSVSPRRHASRGVRRPDAQARLPHRALRDLEPADAARLSLAVPPGKRHSPAAGKTGWLAPRRSAIKLCMDFRAIRLTIRHKLESGRLPLEKAARVLGR